jgi:hypothetical protein
VGWLGPDHVERFGADPALLVKLLDAGELVRWLRFDLERG